MVACLNGLDVDKWAPDAGKARAFRRRHGIPDDCYLFGTARIPIKNGCGTFRRNDLVDCVLQHENLVAHSQCQSTTAPTFSN